MWCERTQRNGLLFHGLVNGDLIPHVHLIKLVNATDALM
jgi:hypothetical protein